MFSRSMKSSDIPEEEFKEEFQVRHRYEEEIGKERSPGGRMVHEGQELVVEERTGVHRMEKLQDKGLRGCSQVLQMSALWTCC